MDLKSLTLLVQLNYTHFKNHTIFKKPQDDILLQILTTFLNRKNALFPVQGGAAISNLNLLVRHSMARIRDIEDSQRKFEVSQDFLREQVNQRLAAIEIFLNKEEKQNSE